MPMDTASIGHDSRPDVPRTLEQQRLDNCHYEAKLLQQEIRSDLGVDKQLGICARLESLLEKNCGWACCEGIVNDLNVLHDLYRKPSDWLDRLVSKYAPPDEAKRLQLTDSAEEHLSNNPKTRVPDRDKGPVILQPEMISIPAGTFTMGSPSDESGRRDNEGPQHTVTVPAFSIGKSPITNGQYIAFLNQGSYSKKQRKSWIDTKDENKDSRIINTSGGYQIEDNFEEHPVIQVSWFGARAYCNWLAKTTDKNYRLPSEAEWEYCARAGSKTAWFWGDKGSKAKDYAWFRENSGGLTHSVAEKKANAFGLFDMVGNVWEWTQDCYHDAYHYPERSDDGTVWEDKDGECGSGLRVLRGGSWINSQFNLRSADRSRYGPGSRNYRVGFRIVCCPIDH